MESGNPSGCLTTLFLILAALLGGTGYFAARSTAVDVPPTPQESAVFRFTSEATAADQKVTADIIRKRLNALGIASEGFMMVGGKSPSISVLLPGNSDLQDTISVISQTGDFELVDLSGLTPTDYEGALLWTTHQAETGAVQTADAQLHPETAQPFVTILDSAHLMQAEAKLDSNVGAWTVHVVFDQEGSGLLGEFTAAHIGEALAIVVDGRVLSAPVIQSAISGEAVITGNFTESEARQLAAKIGFGRLPVPLELVSLS